MKAVYFTILFLFAGLGTALYGQADTTASKNSPQSKYVFRDSVYAAKLNYTGNLMIGGGVGLAGVGTFLIYQGFKTYNTPAAPVSTDPAGDVQRNHTQGTAYIAGGAIAFIGSAVLIALGAKNKVEFKHRKKLMSLQTGWLDDGKTGVALTF